MTKNAVDMARKNGIKSINMDLICGFLIKAWKVLRKRLKHH